MLPALARRLSLAAAAARRASTAAPASADVAPDLAARVADAGLLQTGSLLGGEWVAGRSTYDVRERAREGGREGGVACPRAPDARPFPSFQVHDPATGSIVASVARAGDNETRVAVEEAATAFAGWRASTGKERAAVLRRWHALILESMDDIATIMSVECGKPRGEARAELASAAAAVDWCAGEAVRLNGTLLAPTAKGRRGVVMLTPVGVAGGEWEGRWRG
jgi:acyl-CoA reductase-like NAD-dependent aldehyde dehydrogenase